MSLWFNSNGDRPSEVTKKLKKLGFKVTTGNYDYEFDWHGSVKTDDILLLGDKVQAMLKGSNVSFKLEST